MWWRVHIKLQTMRDYRVKLINWQQIFVIEQLERSPHFHVSISQSFAAGFVHNQDTPEVVEVCSVVDFLQGP